MKFNPWELAFGLFYHLITSPPLYVYYQSYRMYRKLARAWKANVRLSAAAEQDRQAREEANRNHVFMRLPGEVRNRIYSLSMVSGVVIDPIWGCVYDLDQVDETKTYLEPSSPYSEYIGQLYPEHRFEGYEATWARMMSMSQVCRVWRIEAMKHCYGNNVFKLPMGKHLQSRKGRPTERTWYTILNPSNWRQRVEPAGRFADRRWYTAWLQKRPKESFAVMRLVLHDYRRCPHFTPQHSAQTLRGSCMILLDFEKRALRVARGMNQRDFYELWGCSTCWQQFVENVMRLNRNEEMKKLFAEFHEQMHADSAIRVVDGVRGILEAEYQ